MKEGPYMLLSVSYDGEARRASLKLYDVEAGRIKVVRDSTGHKPYFYTDIPPSEIVEKYPEIISHRGFDHLEVVEKYNALLDRKVKMTKIFARDPLSVGGGRGSMREYLGERAWEARIKYHRSYTYDLGLVPGMLYRLENGRLAPVEVELPRDVMAKLRKIYQGQPDLLGEVVEWIKLFHAPIPNIRRTALDIEVYSPEPDRIPNPGEAAYPVIAVSFCASDGRKEVLLLKRGNAGEEVGRVGDAVIRYYDDERELMGEVFRIIGEYPVVLTFNGDNFDLPYLRTRAMRIGFKEEDVPIEWSRRLNEARLKEGVHVDLYKFFNNRSMQVYAFSNSYREGKTLDEIARALLKVGKVEHDKPISDMTYEELAEYTSKDSELTYRLTGYDNGLVMNLIILLMRISKLSLDDLTRHSISTWIKSLMYYEHRKLNYLILNSEEIIRTKGVTATRAIIKGKKYLGAIVIDPPPGVFLNVVVVDFASLYPSVIKKWNLSYETVRCGHDECRSNIVPGTPHWVCRKRRGLTSKIVGFLRDLRVYIYKPLVKAAREEHLRHQYDAVQKALKVFINASYGVFGADTFPFYCPPVAECTAALGRYSIAMTLRKTHEMGIPVLYGDTDSLFLWNPTEDAVKKLISWVLESLLIDLEVDKVYKWIAFSGRKKNYIGAYVGGDVDIKGLLGKKRNTPEFIKKLFYDVVEVLGKADSIGEVEKAVRDIKGLTKEVYDRLRHNDLPLNELAFRITITKPLRAYVKTTPQHIKAARQLARLGKKVGVGDIITYVKVRSRDGVKAIQLARIDEIDQEKYVEQIKTALEQVLEALGTSFDEIIGVRLLEGFIR